MSKKKIFSIGINREISYLSSVDINIEAETEEEARELALKYAYDIDVSDWSDDSGTETEEYSIDYSGPFDPDDHPDDYDLIVYNRDDE